MDYANALKDIQKSALDPDLPLNALRNCGPLLFSGVIALPSTVAHAAMPAFLVFGTAWRRQLFSRASRSRMVTALPFVFAADQMFNFACNIVESRHDRTHSHRIAAYLLGAAVLGVSVPFQAEAYNRIVGRAKIDQNAFKVLQTMLQDLISLITMTDKAFINRFSSEFKRASLYLLGSTFLSLVLVGEGLRSDELVQLALLPGMMASELVRFKALQLLLRIKSQVSWWKFARFCLEVQLIQMAVILAVVPFILFLHGFECGTNLHRAGNLYTAVGGGPTKACQQCEKQSVPTHGALMCEACDPPAVVACAECRGTHWITNFFSQTSAMKCSKCETDMLATRKGGQCSECRTKSSSRWFFCPRCTVVVCQPCWNNIEGW